MDARMSCLSCRNIVPRAEVARWIDQGKTGICPRCGVDGLVDGVLLPDELEAQHVLAYGGVTVLLEALRRRGVVVQRWVFAVTPEGRYDGIAVQVGPQGTEVLVVPPRARKEHWRLTFQTRSSGSDPEQHQLEAAASGVRLGHFRPAQSAVRQTPVVMGLDWKAEADCADRVATILSEMCIEEDLGDLGDLSEMRDRTLGLVQEGLCTTPWGATITVDHRTFARLNQDGPGAVYMEWLLPPGTGRKAARRRKEVAIQRFRDEHLERWFQAGFGEPLTIETGETTRDGVPHGAIWIGLSLPDDEHELQALRWAWKNRSVGWVDRVGSQRVGTRQEPSSP